MPGITSPILEPTSRLSLPFGLTEFSDSRSRFATAIFCVAYGVASGWILTYILARSVQPYPIDAFEEYQIQRATGWMQGATLYGKPSEAAFPEVYPPLYFWVLGLWLHVFGESFVAARLLSLAALMGVVACGWWSLRDAPPTRVARLAFLTILLSFHPLTAKFYEVAKPDMVLTLFLALAIVAGEHRSWSETWVSSIALLLASLTKQNGPLFLAPLCLAHALTGRWRWAIGWGIAMSTSIAAMYCLMNMFWHGNFFYWVFVWTSGHAVDGWAGMMRTLHAVAVRAPLLLAVVVGSFILRPRCRWTWCLTFALCVAVLGMSKAGGRENHLLPAAFTAAVVCARAVAAAWGTEFRLTSRTIVRASVVAILSISLWSGLPTKRDFRWLVKRAHEVDDWVAAVRQIDGSVAVSHHRLLAQRAGVACFFSDLIMEFPGLVVPATIRCRIEDQEFDYLLLETDPNRSPTRGWYDLIASHYLSTGDLDFENRSDLLPQRLYVARRLASQHEP